MHRWKNLLLVMVLRRGRYRCGRYGPSDLGPLCDWCECSGWCRGLLMLVWINRECILFRMFRHYLFATIIVIVKPVVFLLDRFNRLNHVLLLGQLGQLVMMLYQLRRLYLYLLKLYLLRRLLLLLLYLL
uniref:Uncharacterized protein n=1 Tax=Anopheles culicifacies TaxID=139723 RepID=A0A182MP70_9DIPT